MKKHLALFDFDGTITTTDTLFAFIRFYHGNVKFLVGLAVLSPVLALHVAKIISNWRAKEILLSWYFKNETIEEFSRRGRAFAAVANTLVRPAALAEIRRHQQAGSTIAVVSASVLQWVKPWCDQHNLACIATRLEVKDGRLTGRFEGLNCHGPEKENRIRKEFALSDYEAISAYGDSSGDREMLALAHHKFFKPFRGA